MDEEDEHQELKKYICKVCNLSFVSGKSLGGHMRAHKSRSESDTYGLRQNPKKSYKSFDSKDSIVFSPLSLNQDHPHLCKVCRKGFNTPRALSGHMRSHSNRKREGEGVNICKECGKVFMSIKAMFGHMKCHSGLVPIRKKRSKRPRYNMTPSLSLSSFSNVSCSEGEDDMELLEGAICLMMLSGKRGDWSKLAKDSVFEEACGQNDSKDGTGDDLEVCGNGFLKESDSESKGHECSICLKVFRSGQALGGHKRAHFSANFEGTSVEQESAVMIEGRLAGLMCGNGNLVLEHEQLGMIS